MTRQENLQKRSRFGLDRCFPFCHFLSLSFYCAYFGNKAWLIGYFWAWHIIPYFLYHACMHHTKHQVRYLMSNLFPKVKKYGRPFGSSDQRHKEYSRRMQAWHPRGEGTSGHIDKSVRRPHQNTDSTFPRSITLAKSTGPSTIRLDYELSAT